MKCLLVVMAKEPVPGLVKTRLQPEYSPREGADIYRCFLRDRFEEMEDLVDIDKAVAFAPSSAAETFATLAPSAFRLFPQQGSGLGEKLSSLFSATLDEGYEAVSVIDSDSPDLPGSRVTDSFRLLAGGADVVFGPCHDGGYYLVGMKRASAELFTGIPWSTSRVLEKSIEKADTLGLKVSLLPPWQDIDTSDDLRDFFQRHRRRPAGGEGRGRHTMTFLSGLTRAGIVSSERR